MNLPISTSSGLGLVLAGVFGLLFGVLLNKGRVTDYNVIVNLFRFRDWTVLKVMLTAIVVGGLGVATMMSFGWLEGWHIKDTNLLGLLLGGALFGVGMAVYGYCPGTGVAAVATGSVHALVGFGGMLVGGVAYALSYPWVKDAILSKGAYGKIRLTEITPIPEAVWWIALVAIAGGVFWLLSRSSKPAHSAS
ncbi:MAG: hypothetical protein CMO55_21255 [Verrucomicrobiales bacterium]|nr:hypothetical protein [Verrucomicrobiales bacterium]